MLLAGPMTGGVRMVVVDSAREMFLVLLTLASQGCCLRYGGHSCSTSPVAERTRGAIHTRDFGRRRSLTAKGSRSSGLASLEDSGDDHEAMTPLGTKRCVYRPSKAGRKPTNSGWIQKWTTGTEDKQTQYMAWDELLHVTDVKSVSLSTRCC